LHTVGNKPVFDKVIVITDRVVLDRQLQDTIYQFDHVPGVVQPVTEDSQQLAEALTGPTARIVITTLQKFPFVLHKVAALRERRYAVIIDEAHSSQSGESAAALKKALGRHGSDDIDEDGDLLTASALARGRHPNLSYFAFTATPKAKTLELFGTHDEQAVRWRPLHVYSMRQAIDEGFILDVLRNYITYTARWRLANAAVDAAEAADPERLPAPSPNRQCCSPAKTCATTSGRSEPAPTAPSNDCFGSPKHSRMTSRGTPTPGSRWPPQSPAIY
jgi:type I restriction enzyme R subunit